MDLAVQRHGDCVVISLRPTACFYESRAEAAIEDLGKIAEELHRQTRLTTKGVMILQQGAADDRHMSWAQELASTCLFNDLVHRIDTWRWLLSLIRNSPVPWVYAAAGSCQGSAWELALSCQRRYWYSCQARVGFPEIDAGAFPPGGVLESLNKRTGRTRERWQAQPVFRAPEALADGLLDFCSDAQDWMIRASNMFGDMLRVSPSSGVRELRRQRGRDDQGKVDQQSSRMAFEQIESVWRHERVGSATAPLAWDYCWQLISERGRLKQAGDLGRLICLIASQHLLSSGYAVWLRASLVTTRGSELLADSMQALPPVVIDLNTVAPPTAVMMRLLRASVPLIFSANDSRDLMIALNLLFSRLERSIGLAKAYDLWEHHVTWYIGPSVPAIHPVLRWTIDDAFHVLIGQDEWRFLRIDGNAGSAAAGAMEWAEPSDQNLPTLLQSILSLTSDAVIHVKYRPKSLPASVHIRSLFFEEMLHISRHADGDLSVIVSQLKAAGWGFAGDEDGWDRFLRMRLDAYRYDVEATRLGERSIARGHWEMGGWKQAKAAAKRAAAMDTRWNTTALSQHMALFLGLLAELLARSQRVAQPEAADYLCKLALGMPIPLGSPLTFLRQRGRRRVEHYAAVHWPRLPFTESITGRIDGTSV